MIRSPERSPAIAPGSSHTRCLFYHQERGKLPPAVYPISGLVPGIEPEGGNTRAPEGAARLAFGGPRDGRWCPPCGPPSPLDKAASSSDNRSVGKVAGKHLWIADARGSGAGLRVTWHADRQTLVLSHWRDDACVASTRVDLTEVPKLITMLVEALGQAALTTRPDGQERPERRSVIATIRRRFGSKAAPVTELHPAKPQPEGRPGSSAG